jgi:hypothetical protein
MMAKTTLELSVNQVSEIIAEYVTKNFPAVKQVSAANVKFNVSAGIDDRTHYSAPSLVSAKIEIQLDSIK